MVYNNADFCGTPWELSIRSFRKLHGHEEHSTIRDYLNSFLSFLNSTYNITSIAKREAKLKEIFRRYLKLNYDDLSQKHFMLLYLNQMKKHLILSIKD